MSYWAHVNASIRIDSLRLDGIPKINFNELLKVSTYEKPNPECNLPCGSEGSLEWSLWENPEQSCLAAYSLHIFGDLRDFESYELPGVLKWWKGLMKKLGVRQAVLQIEFEDKEKGYIFDKKGKRLATYDPYDRKSKKSKRRKKNA